MLPLTILFNTNTQVCARSLVHLILVKSEELVIGRLKLINREVYIALYVGGVARVFAEVRQR